MTPKSTLRRWPAAPLALLGALALAACGSSPAPPTGSGAQTDTPKTVQGSLPAPVETPERHTPPPATPGQAPAPRSVVGSLPSPTAPGGGRSGTSRAPAPRAAAVFTFRGGRLTPPQSSVPAALPFELTLVAADGRAHAVTLHAAREYALRSTPGHPSSLTISGLRAGTYLLTSGSARARLLVQPH